MPKKEFEAGFTMTWSEWFEADSVEEADEKIEQYFKDVNSGKIKIYPFGNMEMYTDFNEIEEQLKEQEFEDEYRRIEFMNRLESKKPRRFK